VTTKRPSRIESEIVEQLGGVPQERSLELKRLVLANYGKRVRYVVTSAQNMTPVHRNGLASLLTYCKVNKAQLLVIPYRYKNPTSVWSRRASSADVWAKELLPYLIGARARMNRNLVLLADIMTQPTASRPLEGFESLTGSQSAIVGHPKLELVTVATPQEKLPKILTTTGAITKKNYIPSKLGKKGEHHHTFGACVVELDGDLFHFRQLNMKNDGSFCDLLSKYDGSAVSCYARVPALVMGDTHVNVVDSNVVRATFIGVQSMVEVLKPETLVWHDVYNGTARNHHDRGHVFHNLAKQRAGRDDVEAEIRSTIAFIDQYTPQKTRNVIVPSNHNDWLRSWVEETDPRDDPKNVMFWAETFLAVARSEDTAWTESGVSVADAFAYWGGRLLKRARARTKFLKRGESCLIRDIEVGYHGDKGPNGSRGSRVAFGKIGVKSVIGHAHSPGITDGSYQVGTSSRLDLTYAAGSPSSWLHAHAIILPNGKRQLLCIIEGNWRA
jgi:hypothetical protein